MATDKLIPHRPASISAEKLATYRRVRGYGIGALDAWKAACYSEEQRVVRLLIGMPTDEQLRWIHRNGFPHPWMIRGKEWVFKSADSVDWNSDSKYRGWERVHKSTYQERRSQEVFLLDGKDFNRFPSQNQIKLYQTEQEMVAEYKRYAPKNGGAWARRKALERRQELVKYANDQDHGHVWPGEYYLEDPQGNIVDTFHSVDDTGDVDAFIEAAHEMLRSAFR